MAEKTIWDLELHEQLNPRCDGTLKVTRVPGGWIYTVNGSLGPNSVFVPYSEEDKPVSGVI